MEALTDVSTLVNCFEEWEECRNDPEVLHFLENVALTAGKTLNSISFRLGHWRRERVEKNEKHSMDRPSTEGIRGEMAEVSSGIRTHPNGSGGRTRDIGAPGKAN